MTSTPEPSTPQERTIKKSVTETIANNLSQINPAAVNVANLDPQELGRAVTLLLGNVTFARERIDPNMIVGKDANGRMIEFTTERIRKVPLVGHNKSINALTYVTGAESANRLQKWAQASQGHDLIRVMPAEYDTMSSALKNNALVDMPAPWRNDPFYVLVHADGSGMEVELTDGTKAYVGGLGFAKLLHNDRLFQAGVRDGARPVVMIACNLNNANRGKTPPGMANGSAATSLQNGLVNYRHPNPLWTSSTTVETSSIEVDKVFIAYTSAISGGQWFQQPRQVE